MREVIEGSEGGRVDNATDNLSLKPRPYKKISLNQIVASWIAKKFISYFAIAESKAALDHEEALKGGE